MSIARQARHAGMAAALLALLVTLSTATTARAQEAGPEIWITVGTGPSGPASGGQVPGAGGSQNDRNQADGRRLRDEEQRQRQAAEQEERAAQGRRADAALQKRRTRGGHQLAEVRERWNGLEQRDAVLQARAREVAEQTAAAVQRCRDNFTRSNQALEAVARQAKTCVAAELAAAQIAEDVDGVALSARMHAQEAALDASMRQIFSRPNAATWATEGSSRPAASAAQLLLTDESRPEHLNLVEVIGAREETERALLGRSDADNSARDMLQVVDLFIDAADIQFAEDRLEQGRSSLSIAWRALDIAIDVGTTFFPAAGAGRSLIQIATGKNVLTGEPLSDLDFAFEIINIGSLGASSSVLRASEELARIVAVGKRSSAKAAQLAERLRGAEEAAAKLLPPGARRTSQAATDALLAASSRQVRERAQNVLQTAAPARSTRGRTFQYYKTGGAEQMKQDFESMAPHATRKSDPMAKMPLLYSRAEDGTRIISRQGSTEGFPTLEIQLHDQQTIKIRYVE